MRDGSGHGVTGRVTGAVRAEARASLALAVPLVAAQLASVAMGVTDTFYLGSLGPSALAGGGLASSIHVTTQIVSAGALSILAPLFAEAIARRDDLRVASLARTGLVVAAALSVACVAVVLEAGRVSRALGGFSEVVSVVDSFARAVAWATPFALVSAVFRHLLTAAGRPRIVTAAAFIGAALNVVLDAFLVRPMGPTGVGAATAISNAAICVILVAAAARTPRIHAPTTEGRWADPRILRELLQLGAPTAAMIAGEVAVFQLAGLIVEGYGTSALAAHQLVLTVVTATFVVPLGIAQAAAVRVAQAGAIGGALAQRRAGLVGLVGAALVAGICAVVLLSFPDTVAGLFVDDGETKDAARSILRWATIFLFFDAAQVVAAGALRGLRDTRIPAITAVCAYGLLAPAAAALATGVFRLRLLGIWLGLSLGLVAVAIVLVQRFFALTRAREVDT